MAAVTSTVIGGLSAGYKIYKGIKQEEEGSKQYDRTELTNAFEDMPISTLGSDIIQEGNNQASANAVDAIQNAGDRAIIGASGRVVNANNIANQEARSYLDDQISRRAYAIGQDNVNIRNINESRDNSNIAALASLKQSGEQNIWDGIRGAGASANYGARNIDFTGEGSWNDKQMEKMAQMFGMYNPNLGF